MNRQDEADYTALKEYLCDMILEEQLKLCLLYTSDAADDLICVDLGGLRTIKKKNKQTNILLSDIYTQIRL